MDEVQLIKFSPPLSCTVEEPNGRVCGKPATAGQAVYDERGFYRLTPICKEHVEMGTRLYPREE